MGHAARRRAADKAALSETLTCRYIVGLGLDALDADPVRQPADPGELSNPDLLRALAIVTREADVMARAEALRTRAREAWAEDVLRRALALGAEGWRRSPMAQLDREECVALGAAIGRGMTAGTNEG